MQKAAFVALVWFRKSDFLDYLFVFSVAALNDGGSHLLLFPEWTTLRGKAKQQSSDCTKTGQRFLTAACRAPTSKSLLLLLHGLIHIYTFSRNISTSNSRKRENPQN